MQMLDIALTAVRIIERVGELVRGADSGAISADVVLAKLKQMHAQLDENNATADAALRDKFKSEGADGDE